MILEYFFQVSGFPQPSDWCFELAVEVDIHPLHQIYPGFDMNRDLLVTYPVLRLHPSIDQPLKWFTRVMSHWASKFPD
jgi:hypothetical protein